ncbi:MAG: hypothetical protein AB8H03_16480 [Saprospiraceae bacterium]
MNSEDIFIGRDTEINDFIYSLDDIIGKKPSLLKSAFPFLFKKAPPTKPKPRIFLYHGEGGFGKSKLVETCLATAQEMRFMTIFLDWDDYYAQRSTLPNTSLKMIKALFTVLTDESNGIADFFDEYLRIEKKMEDISAKIERIWKEDATDLIKPAISAGSAASATSSGIPVPKGVQNVIAKTINAAHKEFRTTTINYLRDNRKMKREEIDLYEDNERALTHALINGLEQASKLHPIVLAIDTYEQVDEGADIDDWMRNVFLKKLLDTAPRVCVILAGRKNHYPEYRNDLPYSSLYNRNFDDILFTENEILAFAKKYDLALDENEALLIRGGTAGIPLVVNDILLLIKEGNDKKNVLDDLDKHAGTVDNIINQMVQRFLKYTEKEEWKEDQHRCYQMAMLREFDPDLLKESWKLETNEFAKVTKELSRKHSFIDTNTHRMHDKVREFLRKYLISQYRINTAEKLQIQELALPMLEATKTRLEKLQQGLPDKKNRYADNRFVSTLFDLFLCQIWADSDKLIAMLPSYLIELLVYAPEIAKGFALQLEELAPVFPTSQSATIKIIYQGIHAYEALDVETATRLPLPAENKLFEYFKQKIKWIDKEQQALFDFQYGN